MGEASFGKYRLIAELGHGGMADVFLAVMAGPAGSGFSKLTVVKRLRQNLADEPEFVEMLVDEARISARLNHPNVVQTNEVGSVDGQYFIAMEYLDGQPLHRIQHRAMQKAQKDAAAPPPEGVTDPFPRSCQYLVLVDTLAGLHHAHALADYDGTPLEIVHRDVTPHNVFVTYEGQTKVVDFGIAKAVGRASETRQGVVKGKVRYMAPEQAIGHRVDRRADIFSVGVMLWEAAAGRRLWKDMDDLNIVQALVGGTMQLSPREVNPDVAEGIDRICRKALAFNADDRYATAEDFRVDLEQYLAETGELVSARRKLGGVVSDLFKDKRAEIKIVIEKQLAQLKARSVTDFKAVQVPMESGGSSRSLPVSSGAVSLPLAAESERERGTSLTDAATELYTASRKNRGKRVSARVPVLIGAGALVIATAVFASTRVRAPSGGTLAPSSVSAEPVATDVHVRITTTPPTALVSVDGAPLVSPSDAKVPRDGRDHALRVEAVGFDPHVETVRFESDLALAVVLTATKPAATAVSRPTAPTQKWWPPPPAVPAKTTTATAPPVPQPPAAPSSSAKGPKLILDTKDDPWKH